MQFFDQTFGNDAVLRGAGAHVRRIEHRDQSFRLDLGKEVVVVLNLTGHHKISGRFDNRLRSDTPLIHSISVLPPERHFEFKVEGRCRILAIAVPTDGQVDIEPRLNVVSPCLARSVWRAALPDKAEQGESGLAELLHFLVEGEADQTERVRISGSRLRKVLEFVEGELRNSLSTDAMAAVAHMSKFHFSRAFSKAMGTTPHQYVLGRRLAHAVVAIQNGRTLESTALECGFANASHLAKQLRKDTGATALMLRKFLTS